MIERIIKINPAEQASAEVLEQLKSCIDKNQCFLLEAGAGAGKTYSLIESIKYLISKRGNDLLQNRQQIACITYTNIAKDEIKNRTDQNPVIFAETIHAFCWNILRRYQTKLREYIPSLDKWQERIKKSSGIFNQIVKYDLGFSRIDEYEITLHHDDVIALMSRILSYSKFQKILKNKFPIIFIDEYQDTNSDLARSLIDYIIDNDSGIMVGLFGDHWQKIYGSSTVGIISSSLNKIVKVNKKVNFRSDKNIVECLNRIRPELPQLASDPLSSGTIKIFHSNDWVGTRRNGVGGGHWKDDLPEKEVKKYIEKITSLMENEGWDMSPKTTKTLLLTNSLISKEQNFKNLSDYFEYPDDYLKKNNKYIKFFLEVVEPVISAYEQHRYGELFKIIPKNYSILKCQADKKAWGENLMRVIRTRLNLTIGDVLDLLRQTRMPRLPSKIENIEEQYNQLNLISTDEFTQEDRNFFEKHNTFRAISYKEVINLGEYINEKTPFSTKHGVKGAEFDNILIILGRGWNHYNWNQMLEWMEDGCTQDQKNIFERNRNLFYVCCSRAKHNLTLLFTQKLSTKSIAVLERIFGSKNIFST